MIRLSNIFFIVVFAGLFGCSPKNSLEVEDFKEYIKDEGVQLVNAKKISGVNYIVTIEPPEFLLLRDFGHSDIQAKEIKQKLDGYNQSIYCSFVIKDEADYTKVKRMIYNKENYFKLVGYANIEMQKNFKLSINNEEVYCTVCHMEAPSTINPEIRIAVAFDYDPKKLYGQQSKGCEIEFQDDIFNNGIIKFSFDAEMLKSWPELKI